MKASKYLSVLGLLMAAASPAFAGFGDLNMKPGVTPISNEVYELHMLILEICVVIGIGVFGAMFYSMYAHRKSRGAEAAHFHHSTKAEIIWTVIPCLILIVMAYPATQALIRIEDDSNADMSIKVTGFQWAWRYEYVGQGVSFYSTLKQESRQQIYGGDPSSRENYLLEVDNEVVVPVDKKVKFLVTADDVIHSWWVPAFGMKRDAVPGFVNQFWVRVEKPGTYRGQCAELCGKDHGFMPIVVVAKTAEEYDKWLAEQKSAAKPAATAAAAPADQTPAGRPAVLLAERAPQN